MRIAVLGLGRMGQALAGRLIEAGHEVTVWNRSPQRADELRRSGATLAASPVEAIEPAQVVLTSLADDEAVRAVAFGEQGIERAIGSRVYADTSTVSPALSMELARRFPRFIALPVLGAPQAVRSGAATYLAGGRKEAADELGPVFDALGGRVTRYERAEMAASAKLAVNLLLLSSVVALAESFAVARSGGLDDDQLLSLLADSPMVPAGLKNRFTAVLRGSGPTWWTTTLGSKDARLAGEAALSAGIELRLAPLVRDRYREAAEQGFGHDDIVAVAKLYELSRSAAA